MYYKIKGCKFNTLPQAIKWLNTSLGPLGVQTTLFIDRVAESGKILGSHRVRFNPRGYRGPLKWEKA